MRCLLVLTLLFLSVQEIRAQTIPKLVFEVEENVNSLATEAERLHNNRCNSLSGCSSDCTQPACAKSWDPADGFECNENYGFTPPVDADAAIGALQTCRSNIRGINTSVVRLPTTNADSTVHEEFICQSRNLEPTLAAQRASGNLTAWQYVSNSEGGIRLYPGAPQDNTDECSHYDARLRPWYLAASSGPRDVIIMMSTSNNTFGEKFVLQKCVVDTLLRSMGENDYVDVVAFDKSTASLGTSELQRASPTYIKTLRDKLAALDYNRHNYEAGEVSWRNAFNHAFTELYTSTRSSNCQKVIIFLSDGAAIDLDETPLHVQHLKNQYNANEGKKRVNIFTYGVKQRVDKYWSHRYYRRIMIQIACESNGVFGQVDDRENPMKSLNAYARFLSAGINGDSTVRWTQNYTDAFGMGDMVTASRPIWDRSTSIPFLAGVVGIDVPTIQFGSSRAEALSAIAERSSFCPEFGTLSGCQMQVVRQESTGYTCPSPYPSYDSCKAGTIMTPTECSSTTHKGVSDRFCQPAGDGNTLNTEDYTCCGQDRCGGAEGFRQGALRVLLAAAATLLIAYSTV